MTDNPSSVRLLVGDARNVLPELPSHSVSCVVTSPPYHRLRDYGCDDQLGNELTINQYVKNLVDVFRLVRRVLKSDGVMFVNLGDCYARDHHVRHDGLKLGDLCGVPWRFALAMQADGWWLRCDCVWRKPNQRPEKAKNRPTREHEYVFQFASSRNYYYGYDDVKEPARLTGGGTRTTPEKAALLGQGKNGTSTSTLRRKDNPFRNRRSVLDISTVPYPEAHCAAFPPDLAEFCIKAGCPPGDTVLDPFAGTGTTGEVAVRLDRQAILIELNPQYERLIRKRLDRLHG